LRTVKRQGHYSCMRLGHLIGDHIPVECGPDVAVPHQLLLDSDSSAYRVQPAPIECLIACVPSLPICAAAAAF